ncbi:MAG: hypothetical protein NXH70_16260 [Hyphomonas sp.]|nr:hypothetical protein [Hyphomonas sp.]
MLANLNCIVEAHFGQILWGQQGMRTLLPLMCLVLFGSQAWAQAILPFAPGAPERGAKITWTKMSTLDRSGDYLRYEFEDLTIFWPAQIIERDEPKCDYGIAHPEILVKLRPDTRITREFLWESYRDLLGRHFRQICSARVAGYISARFYFDTLFLRRNELFIGVPTGGDQLPSFAHAFFRYQDHPLGSYSLESFSPIIFGYEGKFSNARFHSQYLDRVDSSTGLTGRQSLQVGYDSFPDFGFFDVLIWDLNYREYMVARQQAEEDMLTRLMARGVVEMFGTGPRACFHDGSCGIEDVPAIVIK